MVLSQEPYNFNTRAAGLTAEFALVPVDEVLLQWADLIVCMDDRQEAQLREMLGEEERPIVNLGIPDVYGYRDPVLIDLIRERYDFLTKEKKDDSEI
jgi:predicted protein tyrosine phosphatase